MSYLFLRWYHIRFGWYIRSYLVNKIIMSCCAAVKILCFYVHYLLTGLAYQIDFICPIRRQCPYILCPILCTWFVLCPMLDPWFVLCPMLGPWFVFVSNVRSMNCLVCNVRSMIGFVSNARSMIGFGTNVRSMICFVSNVTFIIGFVSNVIISDLGPK